jgi:hypothetical protein
MARRRLRVIRASDFFRKGGAPTGAPPARAKLGLPQARIPAAPLPTPKASSMTGFPGVLLFLLVAALFSVVAVIIYHSASFIVRQGSTTVATPELPGWELEAPGHKIAAPFDIYSNGTLDGIVVAVAGDPIRIQAYNSSGGLHFEQMITHGQGYAPQEVAPLDYDDDGLWDEFLVMLSGSTIPPGVVTFGPEAQNYVFLVFDGPTGQELWRHWCGHLTRGWMASLEIPTCSQNDVNGLYSSLMNQHGAVYQGRSIDRHFLQADLVGDGTFSARIELSDKKVRVR